MKRLIAAISQRDISASDTTLARPGGRQVRRPLLLRWGGLLLAVYWLFCLALLAMSLGRMEFHHLWVG